jgi:AmiR/NasT family two-component response regulator
VQRASMDRRMSMRAVAETVLRELADGPPPG